MYGILSQIEVLLSLKNAWLPHIFFLDTNGTCKDLLSKDSFNHTKISLYFESITNRKTRISRDVHNVCAITIVGTALNQCLSYVQYSDISELTYIHHKHFHKISGCDWWEAGQSVFSKCSWELPETNPASGEPKGLWEL